MAQPLITTDNGIEGFDIGPRQRGRLREPFVWFAVASDGVSGPRVIGATGVEPAFLALGAGFAPYVPHASREQSLASQRFHFMNSAPTRETAVSATPSTSRRNSFPSLPGAESGNGAAISYTSVAIM